MKKTRKYLTFLFALCGLAGLAAGLGSRQVTHVSEADSAPIYPRNGQSGNIMYVSGGGQYFKSGEADLAICCWNNYGSAWSDRVSYRCFGDVLRIMIPYKDGHSETWSSFKICRYNPGLEPQVSQQSGVYNETQTINFSSMLYGHNTFYITGYDASDFLTYNIGNYDYYGIKAENHMYLDLSAFPEWEQENAKFAIYFAYPNSTNESRWSSFCWKVNGQDDDNVNEHLYECIVPNIYSGDNRNLWNLAIAARIDPAAEAPNWDQKWNQTQDIKFNVNNHNGNMIRVTGWDSSAELDVENSISKETRLEFYGRYFLNTVKCSGGDKSKGQGDATTDDMWNAVKYEYQNHLSRFFQGDIWNSKGDEDGTLVEQAMARYDYIVFKKSYPHEDFMNRKDSEGKTSYLPDFILDTADKNYIYLYIIIGTISLLAVSSLILVKKLKVKRK